MSVSINCPETSDTRVFRVSGVAGRFMNANGRFSPQTGTTGVAAMQAGAMPAAAAGGPGTDIRVKVFNHNPTAADLEPCPVDAKPVSTTGTSWCVNNLQVPAYAVAGTTGTLFIVAWQLNLNGTTADKAILDFSASDLAGDLCIGCGSIYGSGGMMVGAAPKGSVALSMAPLMWGLLVAGFEAGRGLLNGQWALDLKHVVGGYCVWDNGGDGETTPLVELRCESPFAVTWKLTLKHGAVSEEYTRPATEWDPLTANVVRRAGTPPAAGVADQLTVIPG